jgi:hypothetical protein
LRRCEKQIGSVPLNWFQFAAEEHTRIEALDEASMMHEPGTKKAISRTPLTLFDASCTIISVGGA